MGKLTYPLTADRGSLKLTQDYPGQVREAIISALLTVRGERVYRQATYGLDMALFSAIRVPDVLGACRVALDVGLEGYPDVTYRLLGGLGQDEGTVLVTVLYSVEDQPQEPLEVPLVILP